MAETAGLALGAISLGIQVCKGIITYADAVRGKTDDLKSLDQKAKTLADTLDLVSKTLQRIQATATNANSTIAVSLVAAICRSAKSCESSLNELEGFVAKYAGGCPVSSPTFRQKCGDVFKTFKYGFNQREVAEMEFKLAGVNSTLLVGLQSLNLNRAAEHSSHLILTRQDISSLSTSISIQQQESNVTHQNTEQTLRKLEAMGDDTLKLGESLSMLIGVGMPGLHDHISDTSATLVASLDSLRGHVSDNSSVILNRLDTLNSSIESQKNEQAAVAATEFTTFTQRIETCTEALAALTARFEAVPTTKGELNVSIQRFIARPNELLDAVDCLQKMKLERSDTPRKGGSVQRKGSTADWSACDCQQRRTSKAWEIGSSRSNFTLETRQISQHWPHCRFFTTIGNKRRTERVARTRIRLFQMVIETALSLSFWRQRQAGGLGADSILRIRNVVDGRKSPSFQVLNCLGSYISHLRWSWSSSIFDDVPMMDIDTRIFCAATQKLRQIFSARRALPTDMDELERNLMHTFVYLLGNLSTQGRETLAKVVGSELVYAFGISVTQGNRNGFSAFQYFLSSGLQDCKTTDLMMASLNDELVLQSPPLFRRLQIRAIHEISARHASIYGKMSLDPLSEAILKNDPEKVSRLVQLYPSLLNEEPPFGFETHFDLALENPICLKALLSDLFHTCEETGFMTSKKLSRLLQSTDANGQSFAERVLSSCMGPSLPDTQLDSQAKTTCLSAGILPLLFKLQCAMRPHSIIVVENCSTCLELYFGELRDRRDRLKLLALSRLGPIETETFALNQPEALDFHTGAVISHLRSQNVGIPSFLITADHDDQIQPLYHGVIYEADGTRRATVTSETKQVYAMPVGFIKGLYSAGFRDFETPFLDGFSLFEHLILNPDICRSGDFGMWEIVDWILKHTSDVWQTLRRRLKTCSKMHAIPQPECQACRHKHTYKKACFGHMLGSSFGLAFGQIVEPDLSAEETALEETSDEWHITVEIVSRSDMIDGTTCLCSPGGRTPFVYFLLSCLRTREGNFSSRDPVAYFEELLRTFDGLWDIGNYYAAFRLFTFEVLQMEHVCDYSEEDITSASTCASNTEEEDIRTLRFEEIMMELDALVVDMNEGKLNWRSWFATWKDYIQRALAEIDGPGDSDNYRRNAVEIGVAWDDIPESESTKKFERDAKLDETEYWLKRIDEI
ncbi:NACHT-NTPase domain-containing protein [Microdochium nivale]|nr:NACHT-NTPase domain-containing protein [Microdochium nivale]